LPLVYAAGPFERQFFFPPPAASGTFLRVKGSWIPRLRGVYGTKTRDARHRESCDY